MPKALGYQSKTAPDSVAGVDPYSHEATAEAVARLAAVVEAQARLIGQQELALARSREIFERASAAARLGLWECDLTTETLQWSGGTYDMFTIARDRPLVRRQALIRYPADSLKKLNRIRNRAIAERTGFNLDTDILTPSGARTITEETPWSVRDVKALASVVYPYSDIGSALASGSFKTMGMLVAPCSIKSLAGIAHSFADNLLTRAADVCLKERRLLVLLVREAPLHIGHLQLMTQAAQCGAVIMPPMPAFYAKPRSVDDIVDHPTFGIGLVIAVRVDKVDISFKADTKTLVHGKAPPPTAS